MSEYNLKPVKKDYCDINNKKKYYEGFAFHSCEPENYEDDEIKS